MTGDVDPRFDPEFQRGYDPAVHRRRRAEQPAVAHTLPPKTVPAPPVVDAPHDERHSGPESASGVRRNGFLVVLPVLGALLLGASALIVVRFVEATAALRSGPLARDDEVWYTLASGVLPACIAGGLLSVIVWLALLALLPKRADE